MEVFMVIEQPMSILLVEDDEVDQMIVKRSFRDNKVLNPLFCANNGEEAFAMLKGDGMEKPVPFPKIILCDLNMPKVGGLELVRRIRKDPELKRLTIFILTTSNSEQEIAEAAQQNVAGYIVKPVTFDSFRDAMKTLNTFWALCKFPEIRN
jgi:CheY-like chemotaxis protein